VAVQSPPVREVSGVARLGKRTKTLVKRLKPSDVAIIDHENLDRVSAEDLIACGVKAVVNAARSSSDRYPNMGPLLLVQAGVLLVDAPGTPLFDKLKDGDVIVVHGGEISRKGELIATGEVQAPAALRVLNDERRREIGEALEAFARNTVEHMLEERELLVGKIELPRFDTEFRDRPALVVVRGVDHKRDLRALRPYIRDVKPVIVAVDGGADALVENGYTPDMIIGDMDSVTDDVLRCGAEVVVHAYPDGRAPGLERVAKLDVPALTFPAAATSEDLAMLLADEKGAALIVAVGTHANLVEFLDKGRGGMASTFLTRLKVGGKLVDAKGVSRLYRQNISGSALLLLVLSAVAAMASAVAVSTIGKAYLTVVSEWWDNLVFQLGHLF